MGALCAKQSAGTATLDVAKPVTKDKALKDETQFVSAGLDFNKVEGKEAKDVARE